MAISGNLSPFATNAHGVQVQELDYTVEGAPTTKTYHGASIVVGNNVIGRIKSWNPTGAYTRELVHVYELSSSTWGRPIDLVPGRSTGYNISLVRTEVWEQELEITFGFSLFNDLMDQTRPWKTIEYLFKGKDLARAWMYTGCWFSERNEDAQDAEGDGVFRTNATIMYVSRRKAA